MRSAKHVPFFKTDMAIETSWVDRLGAVLRDGATLSPAGEPRDRGGCGRERKVYAPLSGVILSVRYIGEAVAAGAVVAMIEATPIHASISRTLRALQGPRPPEKAGFKGLGERPRRIAVECRHE